MRLRKIVTVSALALGTLGLAGCAANANAQPTHAAITVPAVKASVRKIAVGCIKPTPTTTNGFAQLWETIPDNEWAGGDVGISVKISDGRSVWLYGDSWRPGALDSNYFVHSAAIVQDKGCVVAANNGEQLFANDLDGTYYWIHDAHSLGFNKIAIRARGIIATGSGIWGFKDAGFWQTNVYNVTYNGDLTLITKGAHVKGIAPNNGLMYYVSGPNAGKPLANGDSPNNFGYSRQTHPEFTVTDQNGHIGQLVTIAQNWQDGKFHNVPTWKACNAPIWLT